MKKAKAALAGALLVTALSGCTDAVAKLKDSNTVLVTVGSKTITKGDVYTILNTTYGASTAITNANNIIAGAEVEATDEMRKTAEETLKNYKDIYGDTFTTYLEQTGMTEEEYVEQLILSLQAEKLTQNYIDENYDTLFALYTPVKATILEFSNSEDSDAALSELKDGSKTPAEAAAAHNSSSTGSSVIYTKESTTLDSMVRSVLFALTPDDGWAQIPSSDGSAYILVRVDENGSEALKEDATATFKSLSQISDDSTAYYFTKYGFHIWDKTLYDSVASDYPNCLVQDLKTE